MRSSLPWTTLLLKNLAPATKQTISDHQQLERSLEGLITAARNAWPALEVQPQQFMTFLAERMPQGQDPLVSLKNMQTKDLYLACGCINKNPQAISTFEAHYFGAIDTALKRLNLSQAEVDETKQALRAQLFAASASNAASILTNYLGRGALVGWLRIVAVRTAMRIIGQCKAEIPVPTVALDHFLGQVMDPELAYIRDIYRDDFKTAFKQALQRLSVRERNILKQHLIDSVTINKLSAVYRVHRTTMSRWLDRAKTALIKHTKNQLIQEFGISPADCDSIIRLIDSRFDITLSLFIKDESL